MADRLRRLAPDAGRRRARGVFDRGLQRRDGRAHRPLPAPARPFDLRRQPRGHRARRFGADMPLIREWTESTSISPAMSPGLIGPRSPTVRRCAPSSATASMKGCASSASADRASAEHLLRRVIESSSRRPNSSCRGCARSPSTGPRIDPEPPSLNSQGSRSRLRSRPVPPSRRLRHRRGPRRADHDYGAHRQPPAVHLLPARPPLRAELPRPPSARALPGRALHEHRQLAARGDRQRDRGRDRPRRRVPARRDRRRARAAERIAELL